MSKLRRFICLSCGADILRPYTPRDDDICLNCWYGKPKQ